MIALSPAERRDHTTNDREPRAQRRRHRLDPQRCSPDTRAPTRRGLRSGTSFKPISASSRPSATHRPPLARWRLSPANASPRNAINGSVALCAEVARLRKEVAAALFEIVTARAVTGQRRQLGSLRGGEAPRPRPHLPPRRKARRPGWRASMHRHTRCAPLREPGRARRPRPWPAWNLRLRRRKLGGSDGATGLASGEARTSKASLLSTPTGCGTAKSDVRVRLMMSRTAPRIASMAAMVTGLPRPIRSLISAAALASAR
ncbi:hypothetical protein MCBMB27_02759 [Methylobacterium phyllosphaerae]|uniref:Uncharacterized protein n=1 Tax=Methylobacterium phyllosphaerae TaxID=418223 RepID=A0AAE8HVX2_9HYPH|nr:hypothetical protein MCBMB27_02759 [Methylobacterium phyllosphaerae]SFH43845.1 hypothetical protein SAMN05192567_1252 [Methylobacterium phyllosphaerae]